MKLYADLLFHVYSLYCDFPRFWVILGFENLATLRPSSGAKALVWCQSTPLVSRHSSGAKALFWPAVTSIFRGYFLPWPLKFDFLLQYQNTGHLPGPSVTQPVILYILVYSRTFISLELWHYVGHIHTDLYHRMRKRFVYLTRSPFSHPTLILLSPPADTELVILSMQAYSHRFASLDAKAPWESLKLNPHPGGTEFHPWRKFTQVPRVVSCYYPTT
jgi:hypothetical protein